jgi:hypothetical protein
MTDYKLQHYNEERQEEKVSKEQPGSRLICRLHSTAD